MTTLAYNASIRRLLASLAVLDPKEGPVELCCTWFDDLYLPARPHPENYKPGVWNENLYQWEGCFTKDELEILSEFHSVFVSESDTLSIEWPQWEQDPGWHRVRDAARLALTKLG